MSRLTIGMPGVTNTSQWRRAASRESAVLAELASVIGMCNLLIIGLFIWRPSSTSHAETSCRTADVSSVNARCPTSRRAWPPGPRVPEPERRQHVEGRGFRPTVGRGYANQDVFRRRLRVLDDDVPIPVLVKDPRIEKFVFDVEPASTMV